jgi:signal transduction histidine kinase
MNRQIFEQSRVEPRALQPVVAVIVHEPSLRAFIADALSKDFVIVDAEAPCGSDLVVMDLALSAERRRTLDHVPVLIVAARDDGRLAAMLDHGAQDFVIVPCSPEELRARAANLVRVKRARDVLRTAVTSGSQDLETLARQVAGEKQSAEEAHRKADAASRAKDEFLAVLSHELRSPLNAILGWTCILQRARIGSAEHEQAVAVIERNARAQARLIEDLLDVSAMIRGRMRLRLDQVRLAPVLAEALDAIRPTAQAKNVALHSHCDDGDLTVVGDADRLRQVIYNLLTNAMKFTPGGGHVMVRCTLDGDMVEVTVEDSGIGIDAEFLPQVFDRFAQADRSTSREHGGLGLGLAIVRHLVELHGGSVAVSSPGLGQGATFTVRLPALRPPVEATRGARDGGAQMPGVVLLGLRVLFVEGDAASRESTALALEQHGAIVASAATVGEAVRLLDEFQPDLLLSDIGLPEEDGYALLELLQERGRRIPAIALTAYVRPDERASALSAGYWHHIGKPVDIGELVTTISAIPEIQRRGER